MKQKEEVDSRIIVEEAVTRTIAKVSKTIAKVSKTIITEGYDMWKKRGLEWEQSQRRPKQLAFIEDLTSAKN